MDAYDYIIIGAGSAGCVLAAGGQVITFGQYLRPSKKHLPIHEYVTPEAFDQWRVEGERMGFLYVASGPLVRSSYKAGGETQCAAFPVGLHALGGVVCWGFTPRMACAALATLTAQHACVYPRTPGFLPYARGVGLPSLPPPHSPSPHAYAEFFVKGVLEKRKAAGGGGAAAAGAGHVPSP